MSEPFLERLSQFTPDSGDLDRDALLFAAGRASARANRGWIGLSATLASTQILGLALLWPRSAGFTPDSGGSIARSPAPVQATNSTEQDVPTNSHVWSVRQELGELDNQNDEALRLVENEPILRAFRRPSTSAVN